MGYVCARNGKAEARQVIFAYPVFAGGARIGKFRRPDQRPFEITMTEDFFHRRCIRDYGREEQLPQKIDGRNDSVFEKKCHRFEKDSFHAGRRHGRCERGGEFLEQMFLGLRDRYARSEGGEDGIVAADDLLEFGAVEKIALPDLNLIAKGGEAIGRAHKSSHAMAAIYGLTDDFQTGSSGRAEYDNFHLYCEDSSAAGIVTTRSGIGGVRPTRLRIVDAKFRLS